VLEIMGHVGEIGTSNASCVKAQRWHRVAHAQGHTRVDVDGVALPWWWESDGEGKQIHFFYVVVEYAYSTWLFLKGQNSRKSYVLH
jgi:hypothetical protein